MERFNNLKISSKLLFGFATVLVLMVGLSINSITQLKVLDDNTALIVEDRVYIANILTKISNNATKISVDLRKWVLVEDESVLKVTTDEIHSLRNENKRMLAELEKIIQIPKSQLLLKDILDTRMALEASYKEAFKAIEASKKVVEASTSGELIHKAEQSLEEEFDVANSRFIEKLDILIASQNKVMADSVEDAHSAFSSAFYTTIILTIIGALLAIGIAVLITRSIIKQLGSEPKDLADLCSAFAVGDFSQDIQLKSSDTTSVNHSMHVLQSTLKALVDDLQEVSKQHDLGDIDRTLDETRFKGSYAEMAQGINRMVAGHIEVTKKAIACVKQFGEGDLDAPLEQFPGKEAFVNEAVEQVRSNIKALSDDVNMLAEAAADGRVSTRADANKHAGDFRKIVEGVNATLETIVEPVIAVKEATEAINSAAGEISTGNNDLSQRTEQQASSLEETASSMEELAGTVRQNAENAKQANQLAVTASGVAVKGGDAVNQVVNTMADINESARKIEDIISVIDGIAFQTNILALNAAVEAARAGEQGRGFAVVAGEVRTLAQRSASAAKEIKELITDSVGKTTEGTEQVADAGKTMEEVVGSVQRVSDIIGEISAASQEQTTGIDQVNQAVTSMDETTQQNAALVEEAAAAAESLVEQANHLNDAVSVFKLGDEQAASPVKERRASNSPMRNGGSSKKSGKSTEASKVKAVSAKTGTDDAGDWEEF